METILARGGKSVLLQLQCRFSVGSGDVIYGYDFTNCQVTSVGIGLMQITLPVTGDVSNRDAIQFSDPALAQTLRTDWQTNLAKGVEKLNIKWNKNITGMSGCDADKTILENWYYPIAWYNNEGDAAYNYTTDVYDYIQGGKTIQAGIDDLITKVPDLSSPRNIPGFTTTISGDPTADNERFTLEKIANNVGNIHRWTGGNGYPDITNDIVNGTCGSTTSNELPVPSQVTGLKYSRPAGRTITFTWATNPADQQINAYHLLWGPYQSDLTEDSGPITGTEWSYTFLEGIYEA